MNISREEIMLLMNTQDKYCAVYQVERRQIKSYSHTKDFPELFGYSRELFNHSVFDNPMKLVYHQDLSYVVSKLSDVLMNKGMSHCTFRINHVSGEILPVEGILRYLGEQNGRKLVLLKVTNSYTKPLDEKLNKVMLA